MSITVTLIKDYHAAASMYETLTKYHGNIDEYKIYHAQSLYKAGLYNEALNVASDINISSKFKQRMLLLKVCLLMYPRLKTDHPLSCGYVYISYLNTECNQL